jgi:hypothetical protein
MGIPMTRVAQILSQIEQGDRTVAEKLLALDEALRKSEAIEPPKAELAKLRFFRTFNFAGGRFVVYRQESNVHLKSADA